jgi:hypothetical protein
VSVLLNTTASHTATLSFTPPAVFPPGNNPRSVAVSDFNADGRSDLAVANSDSASVSVLLNTTVPHTTTPSFAPQQAFATGNNPRSVAVSDFNVDGRSDLAVANGDDDNMSVLLNTTAPNAATPSFAPQQPFAAGYYPRSAAVGDLNADGRSDLAVANAVSVSVLLNTTAPQAATPSFAPQQIFVSRDGHASLAVGDLNVDGRSDLAVVNPFSNSVNVLLNATAPHIATPSFAARQTFATGNNPLATAVDDFNADGRNDLAVANAASDTVSVLLNTTAPHTTTPSFAPQQPFAAGNLPTSVAVGDFNADGRSDLAVANGDDDTLSVLLNTTAPQAATPSFTPQQAFATGNSPRSVTVGDFNADGRSDLAVANSDGASVSVLLNTTAPQAATPSFAAQQPFAAGNSPRSVAVGDFNTDGRSDLVVANPFSNSVNVLLNTTALNATTPSFTPQQAFATGNSPRSVAVGDFNADGRPDLAVANGYNASVSVLLNTTAPQATTPSFADQQPFVTGNNPRSVAVGDLNADGRPDLAAAVQDSDSVSVLLNTTAPNAAIPGMTQQAFLGSRSPTSMTVGDLNADGWSDLAVANFFSHTVSVLVNGGPVVRLTVAAGDGQATGIWTPFPQPLGIRVDDGCGAGMSGVMAAFVAPASGPSTTLSSASALTDAQGHASVTAVANASSGIYSVTVTISSTTTSVNIRLTNVPRQISLLPLVQSSTLGVNYEH